MKFEAHKGNKVVILHGHNSREEALDYFEGCYSDERVTLAWEWKIIRTPEPEKTESKLTQSVAAFLSRVGAEGGSKSKRKKSPQNQS